ncbi:MAG: DNA polymerase I, partial [Firmicutes bacterium]|nr:DNA polymerase I [Candidatus Colimorpha enterica]
MKRILLLDGNSIMMSSFFGIPLLSTTDGIYTNAITGTLNVLLKYMKELAPDYCAVAFDVHHPTFRHDAYAEYKAGRKPMPEELRPQFPLVKELLGAMGIKIIEAPGY